MVKWVTNSTTTRTVLCLRLSIVQRSINVKTLEEIISLTEADRVTVV